MRRRVEQDPTKAAVLARVRELHALGWHDSRIAREIGVTPRTAMIYRKRLKLKQNPPGLASIAEHDDEIRQHHECGLLDCEISKLLGVPVDKVSDRRRAMGFEKQDRSRLRKSRSIRMDEVGLTSIAYALACHGYAIEKIAAAIGKPEAETQAIVDGMPNWWAADLRSQGGRGLMKVIRSLCA